MKSIKITALLLTTTFSVACASSGKGTEQGSSGPVTRVFVAEKCPEAAKPEALGTLLAGLFLDPVIKAGIKGLGSALKKAGEDKVATVSGKLATHFYAIELGAGASDPTELGLKSSCITIVNGVLSNAKKEEVKNAQIDSFMTRYSKVTDVGDAYTFMSPAPGAATRKELIFSDDIRFFVQYEVTLSKDLTAMRLSPVRALSGRRISKKKGSETDLVLVTSMLLPSKSGTDGAFAIATSNFPRLKEYKYYEKSELKDMGTGWMPLPPVPDAIQARLKANASRQNELDSFTHIKSDLESDLSNETKAEKKRELGKKIAAADRSITRLSILIDQDQKALKLTAPITISASITETQKGNEFLQKIGAYLEENNATIAAPIVEVIDPEKRKAAKATEADAEDTLRIAAVEAAATHQAETAKIGDGRSESKIRVAEIKAQQACRKLRAAGHDDIACLDY